MPRSFAPSPMATVCDRSRPSPAAASRSVASFCALPKTGPTTRPVRRSSSISSTLERDRWKPTSAATRSTKRVKPPDTSRHSAPPAAMVRTRVSAPGFSVTRSRMHRSMSALGSPVSMATRSRRPVSKSISPRMPRSVMAAIWGLMPMKSANSSMHSTETMVESMSEISSRLRRPSQGWTQTSSGK